MNDQRYEQAFRDAASHVATQPRTHDNEELIAGVLAATGDTRPHRGTLKWLAAAAAVVLAVGVTWGITRSGAPVGGIPATASSSPAITGQAKVTLDFDTDTSLPYQSATLDVRRDNQNLTITAGAAKDDKPTIMLDTTESHADTVWSVSVDNDLQLALLPGDADQITSLSGGIVHSQWLPSVAMTAVAVEHEGNPAQQLIWRDTNQQIRNSLGHTLPSATLTTEQGNGSVVVFEDPQLAVWGYLDVNNDIRSTARLDTEPIRSIRGLSATNDGNDFVDATWLIVLPTGATHPRLDTEKGTTWDAAPIGNTGRTAILIHSDRVKAGHTGINTVSYTDQIGQTHTYAP